MVRGSATMITPFLRSSLLNSLRLCELRTCIEYSIGRRGGNSKATLIGSTVHAVMEALALVKLAQQSGQTKFAHDDFGEWDCVNFDEYKFLNFIYDKYNSENPNLFDSVSLRDCRKLVGKALAFLDGGYDPRKWDVFAAEYQFDIPMGKSWSVYDYTSPDGVRHEGQLCLKGTVDFIVKVDDYTFSVTDYKTSSSINDWVTDKPKDCDNLKNDMQLMFYYYCLSRCFPDIQCVLFNLYFIKLDTAFTVIFERSDIPRIEEMIRESYERLNSITDPSWIAQSKISWKCRACPHSKTVESNGETTCRFFKKHLATQGYEKTMAEFSAWEDLQSYGQGGSTVRQ